MNNKFKFLKNIAIGILIAIILLIIMSFFNKGRLVFKIPDISSVAKVEVFYPELSKEKITLITYKDISRSLQMLNFLNHDFKTKDATNETPLITVCYTLKNETQMVVSANLETLWYKDKAYNLKDRGAFVKMAEGLFFYDMAEQKERSIF